MNRPRQHHLRFRSLFPSGRGFAFPCDGQGRVDLDRLTEAQRNNYFHARAMVGRELAVPIVEPALGESDSHPDGARAARRAAG